MLVMAAVGHALGRVTGWCVPQELELAAFDPSASLAAERVAAIDPPEPCADAWLLGRVHEALLCSVERQAAGAHYTSREIAGGLLAWACVDGTRLSNETRICDPAVGGGAFLLAAAQLLLAAGVEPAAIVRRSLWGIDLNPVAVAVTDAALSHWAWRAGAGSPVTAGAHLARSNALLEGTAAWTGDEDAQRFDLVVGNPPFQSQLDRTTARRPEQTDALRARFGEAVTGYADSATLFLLAARRMVRPGGRVALVQPVSVFGARDASRVRAELLSSARLDGVWVAGSRVFSANVRVGAVVLEAETALVDEARPDDQPVAVRRATGPKFVAQRPVTATRSELRAAPSWSHLISATDTPTIDDARTNGRLGEIASATAGFRDEYYGLIPFVAEGSGAGSPPGPRSARLITSGLIDPARCRWGRAPGRFARKTWVRPTVDVAAASDADPQLGAWLERMLVPKVLVACQTRVVEAIVDEAGGLVPSVPVIAVCAEPRRLFDVAAVLLSPLTSAWAVRRSAGSALGGRRDQTRGKAGARCPSAGRRRCMVRWSRSPAAGRVRPRRRSCVRRNHEPRLWPGARWRAHRMVAGPAPRPHLTPVRTSRPGPRGSVAPMKGDELRETVRAGAPVLMPGVWDAVSARLAVAGRASTSCSCPASRVRHAARPARRRLPDADRDGRRRRDG